MKVSKYQKYQKYLLKYQEPLLAGKAPDGIYGKRGLDDLTFTKSFATGVINDIHDILHQLAAETHHLALRYYIILTHNDNHFNS